MKEQEKIPEQVERIGLLRSVGEESLEARLLTPHEYFRDLRERTHVAYNTKGNYWEVTDYEDVRYVTSTHEIFSSDQSKVAKLQEDLPFRSMLNTDPPRHRQLRSLVSQAFTPRAIEQLAPRITTITQELLDNVINRGEMDIINDLSYPLPIIVIAEMLGVPSEDRPRFKQWSDRIVSSEYDEATDEDQEVVEQRIRERLRSTIQEMDEYFRVIIAQRRKQPGSDLISSLLTAQIDGEYLEERDLLGFCTLLLVAGNITTTNLIGNALLCFDEHPEVMEQLCAQPDLMPQAIEEVLRYRSPVMALGRFPLNTVTLGGQQIERGQFVMAWIACANHDPAQFPHPERFDIQRNPNRHHSFGYGIHFCLGAPLARLESKIALTILLQRMTEIKRLRQTALEPVNSTFIYGPRHVPITFTPR